MFPGGSRTICIIEHMFPGLVIRSVHEDPAQYITTADEGSAVDDLYDLYDLDRDLFEV